AMIAGAVNASLEAVIKLRVIDRDGSEHELEFVIDTGYNGYMTLPRTLISNFGLEYVCTEFATLAEGHEQAFDVYNARVWWDGDVKEIEADATDGDLLVGTAMLENHDLQTRFVSGGDVTIQKVP